MMQNAFVTNFKLLLSGYVAFSDSLSGCSVTQTKSGRAFLHVDDISMLFLAIKQTLFLVPRVLFTHSTH